MDIAVTRQLSFQLIDVGVSKPMEYCHHAILVEVRHRRPPEDARGTEKLLLLGSWRDPRRQCGKASLRPYTCTKTLPKANVHSTCHQNCCKNERLTVTE